MQSGSTHGQTGQEYLTLVHSLSDELAAAMDAIARNDLASLEQHIEFQQALCARLHSMTIPTPGAPAADFEPAELGAALSELARNNRILEKVLEQSGRSQQRLLSLCQAYKRSSSHALVSEPAAPTVSCEV